MLMEGVTAAILDWRASLGAALSEAFAAEGARVVRDPGEGADILVAVAADAADAAPLLGAARAAARAMTARGWGAILIVAAPPARTAVELPAERLAADFGPQGVRVICVRSAAGADRRGRLDEHLAQVADVAAVSAALVAASAPAARAARA
jgi:hypothetical protein